jgi:uncharacterized protein YfaP (DUF2135 family)
MADKYLGVVETLYTYGFKVTTSSGISGTLKNEDIPEDLLPTLIKGSKIVVFDNGRKSAKGGILWDIESHKSSKRQDITAQPYQEDECSLPDENSLSCLFLGKNRDTAITLINTLYDSFTGAKSESSYSFAKSLLEINRSYKPVLEKGLANLLYLKSNKEYRLRMWYDKYVRYCNFSDVIELYKKGDNKIISFLKSEFNLNDLFTASPSVSVYTNNIEKILIDKIDKSGSSIQVAVAWFTNPKLLNALIRALGRGVSVTLVTNNDLINNGGYCLRLDDIIDKGGSIHLVEYPKFMNHKFCIFDEESVVTGSYNWTIYAEHINKEHIVIFDNPGMESIVSSFIDIFSKLISEFERVDCMPETVPDRPQYDRSAFKQYITEEMIFLAKNTRSIAKKDEFFGKALKLNPTHPMIPSSYKTSSANDQQKRQAVLRTESERLQEQQQCISNQISSEAEHIAQLEQQKESIISQPTDSTSQTELRQIEESINEHQEILNNAATQSATIKQEQELIEAISNSNLEGNSGKLRIHLEWKTTDDLDLHLKTPDGQEIFYSQKEVTCNGLRGYLDIDANAGSTYRTDPQENIYWEEGMPEGDYIVSVVLYTYRSSSQSIPFAVTVFYEGHEPKVETRTFTPSQFREHQPSITMFKFKYTKQSGLIYL